MMNPGDLFRIKSLWDTFTGNHPKFPLFLQAVMRKGIHEGTVLAVSLTTPEGEKIETNLKVTASDLELFEQIKQMRP